MFEFLYQVTIDLTQQPGSPELAGRLGGTPASAIGILLTGVMALAAVAVLIILGWGAIDYIVSGGEKGKIEAARQKMTNAIIGIIILASIVAIFNLLVRIFNVDLHF